MRSKLNRIVFASILALILSTTPILAIGPALAAELPAPTGIKATPGANSITISWNAVAGAAEYRVFRSSPTSGFTRMNPETLTATQYIDSKVTTGTNYNYFVKAYDSDGTPGGQSATVTASPQGGNDGIGFKDVPAGAWYRIYLARLLQDSIIGGYPDNTFKPNNSITRAEFAKMICLAMGWNLGKPAKPSFKDVPNYNWAYKYVETAKENGVIGGYPNGTFAPTKNISRAEIAAIIAKTLKLPAGSSSLSDINGSWAKSYINSCVSAEIIGGYPGNVFRPANSASRAEACKMMYAVVIR